MMEAGAHLSSIAAVADSSLPSIFEVIAQESLVSTLKPAVHHVLRVCMHVMWYNFQYSCMMLLCLVWYYHGLGTACQMQSVRPHH